MDIRLPASRRQFVTGAFALGASGLIAGCMQPKLAPLPPMRKIDKIGIQLYTLREMFMANPASTIKMIADLGYSRLEYAHMDAFKTTTKELRKMCDDNGLQILSGHFNPNVFFDTPSRVIDMAGDLGLKYVINSWINEEDRHPDGYKREAGRFNKLGMDMRKAGFGFAYHNHQFEFAALPGIRQRGIDILMAETDPDLVKYELDMYWVVEGGGDNITHLKQHPGRFIAYHIKDRTAGGKMVSVGDGIIQWADIFKHIESPDTMLFYVEDDNPPKPEREAVKRSVDFLQALRF
jgi:sugar phosphate isomerase/epimerase